MSVDQKAIVRLELEKNERNYAFEMPIGSPFGESYDAAFEFLKKITDMANEAAKRAEREVKEDSKEE